MTPALPILAASLQLAYSEAEDRLTLVATDTQKSGVHLALTRRLTNRLINGLAHLLERSSPTATTAPADLRDDIILLEHQDALYGSGQASDTGEGSTAELTENLTAPRLVQATDVTITPHTFELVMKDAQTPLVHLSLNRLQVHRVVEALSRRAKEAEWNLTMDVVWLEPDQTEIVFN